MSRNMSVQSAACILSILLLTSATSCKKKSNSSNTGTFMFHIHTDIDTNEVDSKTTLYPDGMGRHFGLTKAQFYISNIILTNVNGQTYSMGNIKVLKCLDSEEYVIGSAPIGVYSAIKFDVGLDDATNSLQPAGFTANGYTNNGEMWYGTTTQGYNFLKIEGFADTTAHQTGANLVHFSYQIGGSSRRKTVAMPIRGTGSYATYQPYTLLSGGKTYIHLICDYSKLLAGVNFENQDSTDSYTLHPGIADSLAASVPQMFLYEE